MSTKTIQFSLTEAGIDSAIAQIEAYKIELRQKCNKLIEALANDGKDVAKMYVTSYGAVSTGTLLESITGFFDSKTRTGFIRTDCPHAIYVEYGTGVVGLKHQHPLKGDDWYDIHHHGDAGWWYMLNGELHWTKGMPARPFMYSTFSALSQKAQELANTVFA